MLKLNAVQNITKVKAIKVKKNTRTCLNISLIELTRTHICVKGLSTVTPGVDKIWIGPDRVTDLITDRITDRITDWITDRITDRIMSTEIRNFARQARI